MQTAYAQKNETTQRAADNTAAAVHDNSPQSESLQRHASLANAAVQRAENPPRPNNTGLPDDLKNGVESLSGYSLDNVRVHYNSPKPATVQALAYTQGTDIHVAPGQEHALPHEAWHVTQQMAGRVTPTTNIGGMPVNDNAALEHEADVMGEKAVTQRKVDGGKMDVEIYSGVVQCALEYDSEKGWKNDEKKYPSFFGLDKSIGINNKNTIKIDGIYSTLKGSDKCTNILYNDDNGAKTNALYDAQRYAARDGVLLSGKSHIVQEGYRNGDESSGDETLFFDENQIKPNIEIMGYGYAYHPTDGNNLMICVKENQEQGPQIVTHYHAIKQKCCVNWNKELTRKDGYKSVGDVSHYLVNPFAS